jgi:hypothetical protein
VTLGAAADEEGLERPLLLVRERRRIASGVASSALGFTRIERSNAAIAFPTLT